MMRSGFGFTGGLDEIEYLNEAKVCEITGAIPSHSFSRPTVAEAPVLTYFHDTTGAKDAVSVTSFEAVVNTQVYDIRVKALK